MIGQPVQRWEMAWQVYIAMLSSGNYMPGWTTAWESFKAVDHFLEAEKTDKAERAPEKPLPSGPPLVPREG